MDRTRVYGSSLISVGYDDDERTLEVEFTDGSINQYSNVPYHIYTDLINAASPDAYFDTNVRNSFYYRRIR